MEPLVPALPSPNEYEETATDNGRILLTLQTHTHTHTHTQADTDPHPPATDLWKVSCGLPCVGRRTCTALRQRALIEQLMLPSLHHSCLPGDTNHSMLKIPFPWSSPRIPPCLCVRLCLIMSVCYRGRSTVWHQGNRATDPDCVVIKEKSIRSYCVCWAPSGLALFTPSCCEHSVVASVLHPHASPPSILPHPPQTPVRPSHMYNTIIALLKLLMELFSLFSRLFWPNLQPLLHFPSLCLALSVFSPSPFIPFKGKSIQSWLGLKDLQHWAYRLSQLVSWGRS